MVHQLLSVKNGNISSKGCGLNIPSDSIKPCLGSIISLDGKYFANYWFLRFKYCGKLLVRSEVFFIEI